MPPVAAIVVVPVRIAPPVGCDPVEIEGCELGVSTPLPVAILYSEIWLDWRSIVKRNFPEGEGRIATGSIPAEKGEPATAVRLPSGLFGSVQLITTWLQMEKADIVLTLAT